MTGNAVLSGENPLQQPCDAMPYCSEGDQQHFVSETCHGSDHSRSVKLSNIGSFASLSAATPQPRPAGSLTPIPGSLQLRNFSPLWR